MMKEGGTERMENKAHRRTRITYNERSEQR